MTGWFRYGHWAAHFYRNGVQACPTKHGNFGGLAIGARNPPAKLEPAPLSPWGQPYGRVCAMCSRSIAREARAS